MKRLVLSGVVVMLWAAVAIAGAGEVKKAKGFIKSGQLPQAIALLEKEINANPTSAEAHYELGNAYILSGRYNSGEERFKSTVQLSTAYADKVGILYRTAGFNQLKASNIDGADACFTRYLEYQPDGRSKLATELYDQGMKAANQGHWQLDFAPLLLASKINPSLRPQIAKFYLDKGDKATDEECRALYSKAKTFTDNFEEKAGRRLLEIAKRYARQPGREAQSKDFKDVARQFLGEATIALDLPDIKNYKKGTYTFNLNAKEQTDHWIVLPTDQYVKYNVTSADESSFNLLFDDGQIFNGAASSVPFRNSIKFKVISDKNQVVTLTVD